MAIGDIPFRVLDLNLLRVFDALWTENSVGGAASRLSITPSAVSHALARLRDLLEDPLFVRCASGMRPTHRAADIGPEIGRALQRLEQAFKPATFQPAEAARSFSVGCDNYVAALLLPGVLARMRAQAPGTWLEAQPIESKSQNCDFQIGCFDHFPPSFERCLLFRDSMVWARAREHGDGVRKIERLGAGVRPTRPWGDLSVPESGTRGAVAGRVMAFGLLRPAHAGSVAPSVIGDPFAAIMATATQDFAALMPKRLANALAQRFALELQDPIPDPGEFTISALWAREAPQRDALNWFRGLLLEEAAALSTGKPKVRPAAE